MVSSVSSSSEPNNSDSNNDNDNDNDNNNDNNNNDNNNRDSNNRDSNTTSLLSNGANPFFSDAATATAPPPHPLSQQPQVVEATERDSLLRQHPQLGGGVLRNGNSSSTHHQNHQNHHQNHHHHRANSESKVVSFAADSYGSTNGSNGNGNPGPGGLLLRKSQSERRHNNNGDGRQGPSPHRRGASLEDAALHLHDWMQHVQQAIHEEYQQVQQLFWQELQQVDHPTTNDEDDEDDDDVTSGVPGDDDDDDDCLDDAQDLDLDNTSIITTTTTATNAYHSFLDMGLASTLSILPQDIVEASHYYVEFSDGEDDDEEEEEEDDEEEIKVFADESPDTFKKTNGERPAVPPPPPPPKKVPPKKVPKNKVSTPKLTPRPLLLSHLMLSPAKRHLSFRKSPRPFRHHHDGLLYRRHSMTTPSTTKSSSTLMTTTTTRPLSLKQLSSARLLLEHVVSIPLSAYLLLASAVISLALIGPLLELQQGVGAVLKVYWRTSLTALILFPLALYACLVDPPDPTTTNTCTTTTMSMRTLPCCCCGGVLLLHVPRLTWMQWILLLLTSLCYTVVCDFFVLALDYTSIGNAVILSNTVSLMLLIGKFCTGSPVTWLESIGALTAFVGAVLCSKDSSESAPQNDNDDDDDDDNANISLTYLGDFYALVAAVGGVGYLVLAKRVRSYMNLYVFMWVNMCISSGYSLLYLLGCGGGAVTFDANVHTGILGWMHISRFDRLPLELLMVLVCNVVGALGFIRAMQYFDNLVIAVCSLLKPVVAELMACWLGVGFLPGWKGWLGNALVLGGTFIVVYQPTSSSSSGGAGGKGLH